MPVVFFTLYCAPVIGLLLARQQFITTSNFFLRFFLSRSGTLLNYCSKTDTTKTVEMFTFY